MSLPITTHWILPFAASLSEPCQQALPRLGTQVAMPNLSRLMGKLTTTARITGDEYDLVMPHEKLLAQQMGWDPAHAPWAAWWATRDGVTLDNQRPWGLLSPCHWLMGRDHLTMLDPNSLDLTDAESKELLAAIAPLFESEGWALQWGHATRWYASHESLANMPTASLDRVIGRNPDVWLTNNPHARLIRRLQSEVQMLLYQYPLNDRREKAGQLTVNSFWLSGCGMVPSEAPRSNQGQPNLQLITTLRQPMLSDDMQAWLQAWQKLDATVLLDAVNQFDANEPCLLTLCGERHAVTWSNREGQGWLARWGRTLRAVLPQAKPSVSAWLSDL